MKLETLSFEVEGFDGGIESRIIGHRVEITYARWPVLGFDVNDDLAKDWVIASLLRTPLKDKTIAALCFTWPSRISKVRKRLREGGLEGLVRKRRGRKAKLVGSQLGQARKLRRQGLTMPQIAATLGISLGCVGQSLKGIPRGGAPEQQELDGPGFTVDEGDESVAGATLCPSPGPADLDEARADEIPEQDEKMAAEIVVESLAQSQECPGNEMDRDQQASPGQVGEPCDDLPAARPQELAPGVPLPPGPVEHCCRYAGTLLIGAAVQVLGLTRALAEADVRRPAESIYDARQAIVALETAWASGLGSLEAMHERDARALGVVLGLERSPSVRTLHRSIAQMVAAFNPVKWGAALLRGLMAAVGQIPRIFGVDGHFKGYSGKEPIDKGYDTKRRLAHRGLSDVLIHDEQGRIWAGTQVGAGDKLSTHLMSSAQALRREVAENHDVVLGFDRGGFCLKELDLLDVHGFFYLCWVPATVKVPDLAKVAPADDGVGECLFEHQDLSETHRPRLLVERDGQVLVPALTNLAPEVSASEALKMLRRVRGVQENDIKAARAFAHIDRLVDRGGARREPDDRLVDNPEYRELARQRREARSRLDELSQNEPSSAQDRARQGGQQLLAECQKAVVDKKLKGLPAKVPRVQLDADAKRAWLKTKNRSLVQPLKYALANSRRWLLAKLGTALAPSDHEFDQSALSRTLEALIRAPGTVRFGHNHVVVTLELPLPPQPHARLAQGLLDLDGSGLLFTDGQRPVLFRLAPRPTRQTLPSSIPGQ